MSKLKNPLKEADNIPANKLKAGDISNLHPVYVPQLNATFYTKHKLNDEELNDYVENKINERNYVLKSRF